MAVNKLNPSAGGIPYGNTAGRPTAASGKLYSNGETARLELYTDVSGWQNIVQETPGVSSVTGSYLESTDSGTFIISGTNFVSGCYATAIGTNGVQINASSTTFNSLIQVTATFTGLSNQYEPYDVKVTNPSNLFGMLPDALYINANPTWVTAAGSLGSFAEQVNATIYALSASDDSTITYSLASGSSLPSGVTLSSSGVISGTLPDVSTNTTYTFTVNATDGSNPAISRTFSFISNAAPTWVTAAGSLGSFLNNTSISTSALSATDPSDTVTYSIASGSSLPNGLSLNTTTGVISGTLPSVAVDTIYSFIINANDGINSVSRSFSILSRVPLSVEYLMVGGGGGGGGTHGPGGGAGGVLTGSVSLTPTQTYELSIGNGGTGATASTGSGTDGVSTTAFSLTAGGGGGGGRGYDITGSAANGRAGLATNGNGGGGGSTASGGAGNGSGFSGGNGNSSSPGSGGGGGGAGAAGSNGSGSGSGGATGGQGGIGIQSSITGTATYYAGGGGGGGWTTAGASGGDGGGGRGGNPASWDGGSGVPGTANTGGGGGGGGDGGGDGANGGSGVIVIAYPDNKPAISNIPGTLTYDQPTRSGYRVYRFTAGTGTITF